MLHGHTERGHDCQECHEWPVWVKIILLEIYKLREDIMLDMTALNDAINALVDEENSVKVALDDLSSKVAQGNSISQADIDAITAKLTGVTDDLKAAVATDDPAPADPGTPAV